MSSFYSGFSNALVSWYLEIRRDLPWRRTTDPYHIWISEIMLSQTQVDTVIPYFDRFVLAFPTVHDLAAADQEDVLKLWEGLGYYSRARNLHKAAGIVSRELSGVVPSDYEALQTLPGLGPYTAAAVTSIAFGNPVPVVDGNVLRVFARFWGIDADIRLPKVRHTIFEHLKPIIQEASPSDFNQAMMELGALICSPKKPSCDRCPLQPNCVAFLTHRIHELPFKSKSAQVPHHTIVVGVIWKDTQILVGKRQQTQMLGGLWEFPGGKCEPDETLEEALLREIKEETDLTVAIDSPICTVKHAYSHFKITLHAFHCRYISGEPIAKSAEELRWVALSDLSKLPFPKANKQVLDTLFSQQFPLSPKVR